MRVLHTTYSWLPGSQTWLARLVADSPDPVVLAITRDGAGPETGGSTCAATSQDGPPVVALCDYLPAVANLGAAYHRWSGRAWPRRADRRFGSAYAALLARAADRLRPFDVVHAHFGDHGYRARTLGPPLVVSFYGYDFGLASDPWWSAAYRRMFQQATFVVAEAPHAAGRLEALGCAGRKVRIHPLGVDLATLPFRPRFPRNPVRVLFAGRFEDKKGLPDALEAIARAGSGFRLTVVGDGPDAPAMRAHAERLRLPVEWLGALPHPGLRAALLDADVLLAPSRTAASGDTEGGLPVVVLEAMATGLPVVGTTHADIPWAVRHERSGLVVPERDPSALAAALRQLAEQPERWPIMGALGRTRVKAMHDASLQPGRLDALYEEARISALSAARATTSRGG